MANEFTGEAFLKALADGSLTEPLIRVGMVKHRAESCDEFLFSEGGCGSEWIEVPVALVEKVTFVRMLPCRDHQHPLVVIEFKAPDKDDKAASLYASLARAGANAGLATLTSAAGPSPTMSGMAGLPAGALQGRPAGTPCGSAGMPDDAAAALARSAIGGGGIGGGGFGLKCIAWHRECRTITIWINSLNLAIPVQVCYYVCDTVEF